MLVILNGKIVDEKKVSISPDNRSFRYGDGCFETMKMVNGKLLQTGLHLSRLLSSLGQLQFTLPAFFSGDALFENIGTLVRKNGHAACARVRLTFFAGDGGLFDEVGRTVNYLVQSWPLNPENNSINDNGLIIGTFRGGFKAADGLSNIKSNNYLLYAMAALHAKQQKWNDALILNHRGDYVDSSIANLFIIAGKSVITPSLAEGPIAGTMRHYLLSNIAQLGFMVLEQPLTAKDLTEADECFLSNAIYGIKWVHEHAETQYTNRFSMLIYNEIVRPLWAGNSSV